MVSGGLMQLTMEWITLAVLAWLTLPAEFWVSAKERSTVRGSVFKNTGLRFIGSPTLCHAVARDMRAWRGGVLFTPVSVARL
jgi:hypothetical protein